MTEFTLRSRTELETSSSLCVFLNDQEVLFERKDQTLGPTLAILNAESGAIVKTLSVPSHDYMTLSNDKSFLASMLTNGSNAQTATCSLWSFPSLQKIREFPGRPLWGGKRIYFSPDDSLVALTASIYQVSTGKLLFELDDGDIVFRPNGQHFVVIHVEIQVYDTKTFQLVKTLGDKYSNKCCVYSPNSAWLIGVLYGSKVLIWNASTFELLKTISEGVEHVRDLTFSSCGSFAYFNHYFSLPHETSPEHTIAVWNTSNWKCIGGIQTEQECYSCIISSNNEYLVTLNFDEYYESPDDNFSLSIWNIPKKFQNNSQVKNLQDEIKKLQQSLEIKDLKIATLEKQIETNASTMQNLLKQMTVDLFKLEQFPHELLGEGAFGEVYLGSYFKIPVAIKKVKKSKLGDRGMIDFKNEIQVISELRHPNIVSCIAYSLNSDPLIVLESMAAGSLYKWIFQQTKSISLSTTLKILKDISLGMLYLHTRKPQIIHRDLKSLNILLTQSLEAKISDFGLSKSKENSAATNTSVNTIGTIPWSAPEYLTFKRKNQRNEKGDVFSFGVIIWELVTRQVPWKDEGYSADDVREAVLEGNRLEIPKSVPNELKQMMKKCWEDDPGKRPSFEQIVNELVSLEIKANDLTNSDREELDRLRKLLKKANIEEN